MRRGKGDEPPAAKGAMPLLNPLYLRVGSSSQPAAGLRPPYTGVQRASGPLAGGSREGSALPGRRRRLQPSLSQSHLRALKSMPMVTGELCTPVSPWDAASVNPISLSSARNAVPGVAPPCHLNQLSAASAGSGGAPRSIWSAICNRPPGLSTRKASARALGLSSTRL